MCGSATLYPTKDRAKEKAGQFYTILPLGVYEYFMLHFMKIVL